MLPSSPRLAGPVKHSSPDPDTVILICDRSLKWPALFGLSAIGVLIGSFWWPSLLLVFFLLRSACDCCLSLFCGASSQRCVIEGEWHAGAEAAGSIFSDQT